MAETTADVRRDIELTRERMSDTLAELERRLNVTELVREHPWPAIALAAGAGFLLSGTQADVKAASATAMAAHATSERASRMGPALDDIIGRLLGGVQQVLLEKADEVVEELRSALGGVGPRPHPHDPMGAAGATGVGLHASGTPGGTHAPTHGAGAAFAAEHRDGPQHRDATLPPADVRPLRAD